MQIWYVFHILSKFDRTLTLDQPFEITISLPREYAGHIMPVVTSVREREAENKGWEDPGERNGVRTFLLLLTLSYDPLSVSLGSFVIWCGSLGLSVAHALFL